MPVLKIKNNGLWEEISGFSDDPKSELPNITDSDNGKILVVAGGSWAAVPVVESSIKTFIDEYISSALEGEY